MQNQNQNEQTAKTLVMKFGGTSVGTAEAMEKATLIIQENLKEWPRMVVIVSALRGVTDLLLTTAAKAVEGDTQASYNAAQTIRLRHQEIIEKLVPDLARQVQAKQEINHLIAEFTSLCSAISIIGEVTPRVLDAIGGMGERFCVRVMSAALESMGIPAQAVESTQLIVTDDNFQAARPDMSATRQRTKQILEPTIAQGRVAVVTGFLAATPEGITTTLGRGGSDYSAAILGVCLNADEVWIWTDVDGVMTADPRMVPKAHTIDELSYNEVAEMAYFGARVLHPKTIHPIIEAGIALRVRNTFNAAHPGTLLLSDDEVAKKKGGTLKAVSAITDLQLITLEGRGMLGVPGVAARIFTSVATTGASVPLIAEASSEQSICFAIQSNKTASAIATLKRDLAVELKRGDIDRIFTTGEVVIVCVVCPSIRKTPGVSGRILSALGEADINVIAISFGSSDLSISLVVAAEDQQQTLNILHTLID